MLIVKGDDSESFNGHDIVQKWRGARLRRYVRCANASTDLRH